MARLRIFRVLVVSFLVAVVLLLAGAGVRHLLRPPLSGWRPIYQGVDYYCREVPARGAEGGRVMALRLHLDTPGLSLMMRPLDPEAVAVGGHYVLSWPDWDRSTGGLDVLVNTAIYTPGRLWESYPGQVVRAVDTVVTEGRATHIHEHSYLLWLDRRRRPLISLQKPPKPEDVASTEWGIGLQGVQVVGGRPNYAAIDRHGEAEARTFIGFNAPAHQLFLIAWENVTPVTMIDMAVELGVQNGGMLDSGNATWMILSPRARGLRPWTGIRGGRPLGPYLGVRAQPLP